MASEKEAALGLRSLEVQPRVGWYEGDKDTLTEIRFGEDAEGYPWFFPTEKRFSIDGLRIIGRAVKTAHGDCIDTGEYVSPLAQNFRRLVEESPEGTVVVGGSADGGCGTRTWDETVYATYYEEAGVTDTNTV